MKKLFGPITLITSLSLAGCGGGGGSSSEAANSEDGGDNGTINKSNVEYIEDGNQYITIKSFNILDMATNKGLFDSTVGQPLHLYPGEDGFEIQWAIEANAVLFSDKFVYLVKDGIETPIFSLTSNPVAEALDSTAFCNYDNANQLTCIKPSTPITIESEKSTEMTAAFGALPATFEVRTEICLLIQGCDIASIGYVQFN